MLQLVLLVATWHSASTRPLDGDGPLAEVGATPAVPAHSYAAYKANVTSSYFTNEDVNTFMRLMADECGHMMSLFSIGQSASGRELLALDISYTSAIRHASCVSTGVLDACSTGGRAHKGHMSYAMQHDCAS